MGVSDKGALPTPLDWDSLVQQLSNVHSNGLESETEAKTRVLSRAILFELQSKWHSAARNLPSPSADQ